MNAKVGMIIAVLVVLILGISGFMLFQNMNKAVVPASSSKTPTSIKNALDSAGNMECNYTDEEGRKTSAYTKNGKVRADITSANASENSSVIFADNTIYVWSAQGAFKMTIPEETMNQDLSKNQAFNQKEDIMEGLRKYKEFCKNANPSDLLFTPPSNLKFKDFSEMMQGLPTGASGSGGYQAPSQQQLEQMMQKYQDSQ